MTCKNCNNQLHDQHNFCPHCGAKVVRQRLTMKNIWSAVNEQFFNLDNKLLKTFVHLITKPEIVINGFIDGTRKKYINVIQYFAISLTLVGLQVFLMNTFFKEAMEIDPTIFSPIDDPEVQKNNPFSDLKFEEYNNYQSVFYTLSVPFSAISTWLAYWIAGMRRFNFTEHLVINLYYSAEVIIINAFFYILLLCFGVDYLLISYISTLFIMVYFFYALKRVFQTSFLMTVAYFTLVMVAFAAIFIALMILVLILGIGIGYLYKNF